jgi:hypothetical protein
VKDDETTFTCKYTDDYANHELFLDAGYPAMKQHYPVKKTIPFVGASGASAYKLT